MNQHAQCPAVRTLKNLLRSTIPELNQNYREHDGTMSPRLQWRAGREQMQHFTGLALDIILHIGVSRHRFLANNLVAAFVMNQAAMQWTNLIYEHDSFTGRGGNVSYHPYLGNSRHNTHIHIDWYRPNVVQGENVNLPSESNATGFGESMRTDLVELNRMWNNNLLGLLNLRTDPLGMSVMRNVGR
jgi:hypothetical protein